MRCVCRLVTIFDSLQNVDRRSIFSTLENIDTSPNASSEEVISKISTPEFFRQDRSISSRQRQSLHSALVSPHNRGETKQWKVTKTFEFMS